MDEDLMKKYRYFIVPRFNQCYNIEKLANLSVSKMSAIHGRYLEHKLCVILIYTNKECTEKEIRNGFENLSTSKSYIKIDEKECKSSRLFFFSTFPPHQNVTGVKNLLNTFAKASYQVIPINGNKSNCIYWQVDFRNLTFAKHALNFIPKIPFDNSQVFISENPFKIPLIQIRGCSQPQSFATKNLNDNKIQFKFLNKLMLVPEENVAYAFLNCIRESNAFVSKLNYTKYKKECVSVQYFLPLMYATFLSFYEVKVSLKKNKDIRSFYEEMNNIGPVYQVYKYDENENNLYVIFKNRNALRKIFKSDNLSVSLSNCSIFTLFNFPPGTKESHIQKYFEKNDIKYISIEKCDYKQNILPRFRIFINIGEEEQFQSFFNDDKCVYNGKTCPFCVQYLFEDKYEALFEQAIDINNTVQISPNDKKTINDIYNDFSNYGCINFLYYDPDIRRYSITYRKHDDYIAAKKFMEINYPPTKTIVVQKEKAKVIQTEKAKGNKLNIEIKKSSQINISFLISSDDDESNDDDSEYVENHSIFSSLGSITHINPLKNTIVHVPVSTSYSSGQSKKVKMEASTVFKEHAFAHNITNNFQNSNKQILDEDDNKFINSTKTPKNFSKNKPNLKPDDAKNWNPRQKRNGQQNIQKAKSDEDDKNYSSVDYDYDDEFVFVSQKSTSNRRNLESSKNSNNAPNKQIIIKNTKTKNNYQFSKQESNKMIDNDNRKKSKTNKSVSSDENNENFLFFPQVSSNRPLRPKDNKNKSKALNSSSESDSKTNSMPIKSQNNRKIIQNRNNSKRSKVNDEDDANYYSFKYNKNAKNQINIIEETNIEDEEEDDEDDEFIFVPQVSVTKNNVTNKKDSSKNSNNKKQKANNNNSNNNNNTNDDDYNDDKVYEFNFQEPIKNTKNIKGKESQRLNEQGRSSKLKLNNNRKNIPYNAKESRKKEDDKNGDVFIFGKNQMNSQKTFKNLKISKKQNKNDGNVQISNKIFDESDDNKYIENADDGTNSNEDDDIIIFVDDDDDNNNNNFIDSENNDSGDDDDDENNDNSDKYNDSNDDENNGNGDKYNDDDDDDDFDENTDNASDDDF